MNNASETTKTGMVDAIMKVVDSMELEGRSPNFISAGYLQQIAARLRGIVRCSPLTDSSRCVWCGGREAGSRRLVDGPGVAICSDCVAQLSLVMSESRCGADPCCNQRHVGCIFGPSKK